MATDPEPWAPALALSDQQASFVRPGGDLILLIDATGAENCEGSGSFRLCEPLWAADLAGVRNIAASPNGGRRVAPPCRVED